MHPLGASVGVETGLIRGAMVCMGVLLMRRNDEIPGRPKSNDLMRDLTVVADSDGVGDVLLT